MIPIDLSKEFCKFSHGMRLIERHDPMGDQGGYNIENVWQRVSHDLKKEIVLFWEENDALPPGQDPEERADQVVFVVRNHRREIVAVNTALKVFFKRFNNSFYFYRTMTGPGFREVGIAIELLMRTRDFFEELYHAEQTKSCIGILFNLENEFLAARFKEAIWPRTKFIFMGNNPQGQQVRVYYFEGAEI